MAKVFNDERVYFPEDPEMRLLGKPSSFVALATRPKETFQTPQNCKLRYEICRFVY